MIMSGTKYANCIISDTGMKDPSPIPGVKSTHLMKVNGERLKDFFNVDCTWYWTAERDSIVQDARTSNVNQVIGFIGLNPADPHDLAGEITVWIDGEKKVMDRSCLIFVPAGISFGPVHLNRLDGPLFYTSISPTDSNQAKLNAPDKNYVIITTTKAKSVEPPKMPHMNSTRILHIEDDMARGSFYVDFVWLYEGYGVLPAPEHTHEWEELIAMAGADPERPHDIGGIMSIDLDGEPYYITESSLACIPREVRHCPWKFLDIRKPTLVFSAMPTGMYTGSNKDKW